MDKIRTFVALLTLAVSGCGASDISPATTPGGTGGGGGNPGVGAATITVTATPSSISTGGTSSIQAVVLNSSGASVADGTVVNFTVTNTALGDVTASTTTSAGVASATFTAASTPGTVDVIVTSGAAIGSATITIATLPGAGISFVSATPQVIALKGSSGTTTSVVVFKVTNTAGQPAPSQAVNFTMTGPKGGEYLDANDATPTTSAGSTDSLGLVSVLLNSGSVAGTVTVTATLASNTTIKASSPIISIGGGVASGRHFGLATSRYNLPGLEIWGEEATITAFVGDRFGNYNVLDGTTVSFYTEAGTIDTANTTALGKTDVVIRTAPPLPVDVAPTAEEDATRAVLNTLYGTGRYSLIPIASTVHWRDGWFKVLATVNGEEAFSDANGNGAYDAGESFTDLGEPFYDKNDDGCRNNGTTKNCNGVVSTDSDPFEEFIDADGNGAYTPPNGVWDGPACTQTGCLTSKVIWDDITLMFTGSAAYCRINPTTSPYAFSVSDSGAATLGVMVADENLNRMVAGTKIEVSASAGLLFGITTYTVPDGVGGPTIIEFNVTDPTPGTLTPQTSVVTVKVTPPALTAAGSLTGCTILITGTLQ